MCISISAILSDHTTYYLLEPKLIIGYQLALFVPIRLISDLILIVLKSFVNVRSISKNITIVFILISIKVKYIDTKYIDTNCCTVFLVNYI